MKTRRRLGGAASYAASALALLALLAWQPAEARAQWATSNSNISNTNAGNVGVGTGSNAPGAKLDVGAGAAAQQRRPRRRTGHKAHEGLTFRLTKRARNHPATGRLISTVVPRPISLLTAIAPPFNSTLRFAIGSPRPVPLALVEK